MDITKLERTTPGEWINSPQPTCTECGRSLPEKSIVYLDRRNEEFFCAGCVNKSHMEFESPKLSPEVDRATRILTMYKVTMGKEFGAASSTSNSVARQAISDLLAYLDYNDKY